MLEKTRLEVERLKMAKVDGIVLDVRDDGGGSINGCDIAGLSSSKALLCKSNQQEEKEFV
jgi:C-terminal processing protease CtpA/Prc